MTTRTSRREFLRRAAMLAGAGAAAPMAINLSALGVANAQVATDYRALVCIFLYGGNDNHNTVVPLDDTNYKKYQQLRSGLALAQDGLRGTELVPVNPWSNGRRMALHPKLTNLKRLFDEQRLAVAMNVGTLLGKTTMADYTNGRNLPPKLFSHNDQQSIWQSGLAEGATSGWGGRMADQVMALNGNNSTFTSISAAGNAVFMSGKDAVQYQLSANGAIRVKAVFGNQAVTDQLKALMQQPSSHLFESDHAMAAQHSIAAEALLSPALPAGPFITLPNNPLGPQLNVVARMIKAANDSSKGLGIRRQVFFVSMGGFDTHDVLLERHDPLLGYVDEAISAFYKFTFDHGLQDKVTTFTGSDFGRTLTSNNDGSDHGWGSYQFAIGGAVKGKTWCGALPEIALEDSTYNVGSGRLLPAISVEQFGATMARWFCGPTANLDLVFPNLPNFDVKDLGFMRI